MQKSLELSISQRMVDLFVQLTGDCSSIHTNEDFARRTVYGTKLVHGMLPVAFITGFELGAIVQIEAKFLKPVFINDALLLTVRTSEVLQERIRYDFDIKNEISGVIVTKGRFITNELSGSTVTPPSKALIQPRGLVLDGLIEDELRLEQIAESDQRKFNFQITQGATDLLKSILDTGHCPAGIDLQEANNLLASSLCSTMAGIYLPGRWATFVDFNLNFENPVVKDRPYSFTGTVTFKSEAARVINNEVHIRPLDNLSERSAAGTMTVMVGG